MLNYKSEADILKAEIKRLRKYQPKKISIRRSKYGLDKKVNQALDSIYKIK